MASELPCKGTSILKAIKNYLNVLVSDPLFLRVCMFLWGLPLATFGAFAIDSFSEEVAGSFDGAAIALVMFLVIILCIGLALMFAALFASEEQAEKVGNLMSEGGDWLGIVLAIVVVIVAIPLTALIRALR